MTRDDQAQMQAIAQREYSAIRTKVPSKIAALASPKLVVLPDRFMRKHGGAGAIYFWLCISPALLQAPKEVRQAIIAHEWGHMALGHTNATIGALVGALLYVLITLATPPGVFWPAVNIIILGMIFLGLYWALHQKREFEADDKGADAVGARTMAHALRWITDAMREGEQTELVRARLQKLEERASREEDAARGWWPLKAWPVDFAGFTSSEQIEARIREIEPRVMRGHEDLCWATWELEQLRTLKWEFEAGSCEEPTEERRA